MFVFRYLRILLNLVTFKKKPRVLVLLYMIQDLDLALMISDFLLEHKISHSFLINYDLQKKSPRVVAALNKRHARYWIMRGIANRWFSLLLIPFDSLITIVESSAGPHRIGFGLTQNAKTLGLHTYTFQHGLENIGLTYFDEKYNKDNVQFASDTIFTWCHETKLHADISVDTRKKCFKVGSPKSNNLVADPIPIMKQIGNKKIISIFENLHWERYDENYKISFVENVLKIAKDFPEIVFILKPHHAGQWLTKKYKGSLNFGSNVIVANPSDRKWEPYAGPDIIAASLAVITTPSTIALDACILQKPVAVIGDNIQSFDFYKPLPLLTAYENWFNFVDNSFKNGLDSKSKLVNSEFASSVTSPGNTGKLVVDKLVLDFKGI